MDGVGRKITILGMGPSAYSRSVDIGRYVAGTEVWGLNNGYGTFKSLTESKGFDRYFEIHSWDYLQTWSAGEINGERIDHYKTMDWLDCPIYVQQPLPLVRNQVEYPFLKVLEYFGPDVEIKGSPSWMLALALYEHSQGQTTESIQSYGIDTSDPSHACQRPSWAQWLVRAELAGIKIEGTATDFRNEPDDDAGLRGLLESKRAELIAQKPTEKKDPSCLTA